MVTAAPAVARILDDGWTGGEVALLDIGRVLPNPLNPRGEIVPETCGDLAASIRGTGAILQPLLVTPYRKSFYIVAGHRRRIAAGLAGLIKVPAIVRDIPEHEQLAIMLVENMQREPLSPMAEARTFKRLVSEYGTITTVARVTGVAEASIKHRLLLFRLDPFVAELVDKNQLALHAVPHLVKVLDRERQKQLGLMAVRKHLPISLIKSYVERAISGEESPGKPQPTARRKRKIIEPVDREAAFETLKSLATKHVPLESLRLSAEATCSSCGLFSTVPESCRQCVLPQLLNQIVAEAARA